MKQIPDPCPMGCNHSDDQHRAFDEGVMAGEGGIDDCPYVSLKLREAWLSGHSVGALNAEEAE